MTKSTLDISSKTNVPLFAVLSSVPFIVGGIMWLANVDAKATEAKATNLTILQMVSQMKDDVAEIKGELKRIRK